MDNAELRQPPEQIQPTFPLSEILRAKLEGRLEPGQPPFTAADYLQRKINNINEELRIRQDPENEIRQIKDDKGIWIKFGDEIKYLEGKLKTLVSLSAGLASQDIQAIATIRSMLETDISNELAETARAREKFRNLQPDPKYDKDRGALVKMITEVKQIEDSFQSTGGDLNKCPIVVNAITDKFTAGLQNLRKGYQGTTTETRKLEMGIIRSDQNIARLQQAIGSLII